MSLCGHCMVTNSIQWSGRCMTAACTYMTWHAVQVLTDLFTDLTLDLIRSPGLSPPQLLLLLPSVLHSLVIIAYNPSIDLRHSLHLSGFCPTALERALVATTSFTDLTDLSFQHQLLQWHNDNPMSFVTSLSNLTSLSLKDTGLHHDCSRTLTTLSRLHRLRKLDLSHNCLHRSFSAVSHVLLRLSELRTLDLSKTVSPASDLHPLVPALRQLPALETFAISGEDTFRWHMDCRTYDKQLSQSLLALAASLRHMRTLRDVEAVFGCLRLKHSQLTRLSRCLERLTALSRLRVSTATYHDEPRSVRSAAAAGEGLSGALRHGLQQLPGLTVLDLGVDAAAYGGGPTLEAALQGLTSLQELRLRGRVFRGAADVDAFAAACAAAPRLRCLELTAGCGLARDAALALHTVAQLVQLTQLASLRAPLVVDGCQRCAEEVDGIAAAMQRCAVRLDARLTVGGDGGRDMSSIAAVLPAVVSLTVDTGVDTGPAGAAGVVLCLQRLPAVTRLKVVSSSDPPAPLLPLLRGCAELRSLRVLDVAVHGGVVEGEDAPAEASADVAEALSRLQGLTALSLCSRPGLAEAAVMAGCEKLAQLQRLSLRCDVRRRVVLHVPPLASLRTLQLWHTALPDSEVFCQEIGGLSSLRVLCLQRCWSEWAGAEVKERLQNSMPHLQVLGTHI
eukprot:jgi/Ulvmu1/10749/UM068_0039.1